MNSPPSHRKYKSLIRSQIDLMEVGESLTFTAPLKIPPDGLAHPATLSGFCRAIGTYAYRTRLEGRWTFESFYAVTLRGRPIVGAILTRSAPRGSKRRKDDGGRGRRGTPGKSRLPAQPSSSPYISPTVEVSHQRQLEDDKQG